MLSKSKQSALPARQPAGTADAPQPAMPSRWRGWLVVLLGFTAGLTAAAYLGVVLVDPFSTGRFTPLRRIDVATSDVQMGHAARVRDPQFDAAIIGDSHAVPVDPARVSAATGLRVAQLAALAMVPREQFTVARAFIRHHRRAAALIVFLDDLSCMLGERKFPFVFPGYLFEGSDLDYLGHIFSPTALMAAARRVSMMMGWSGPGQRVDGFDPVSLHPPETRAERVARVARLVRPTEGPPPEAVPLAFAPLEALLGELDPATMAVLFFVPVPVTTLPAPASAAARWLDACKARYRTLAQQRPLTTIVDRMIDDPLTRDVANFEDPEHLRNDRAPLLERDIVAALNGLMSEKRRAEAK